MPSPIPPERDVFANRTLNLRSVAAIGYDMDYTLLHYRVDEWEARAFEHARDALAARDFPVEGLVFDPDRFIQGLVIDLDLGNLVKATRFGRVVQAAHGTRVLPYDELRATYSDEQVDLSEPRWRFMNTLFSLSETTLYAQLVDLLEAGELPVGLGYDELYREVVRALDESHNVGRLKEEIISDPDRFVVLEPEAAETLLDQRAAGKRLLLVTNSPWSYTEAMMTYAYDRYLPSGTGWRDLFDVVIVSAAKPRFFSMEEPVFAVVDTERGLLEPTRGPLVRGGLYHGGSARLVERSFGWSGDEILYVGDHLFGDVHVSKDMLRWRTALILRELEPEVRAAADFEPDEARLAKLMAEKAVAERELVTVRLARLRQREGRAPEGSEVPSSAVEAAKSQVREIDNRIAPLARAAATLGNPTWGPLMRAGSDKSLFARQVERYADLYTSRVSNLGLQTPYAYLRAARTSLPHDRM